MNLKQIKKIAEKGVKGSGEKQLELFMKNKKTSSIFLQTLNGCTKK
ncbi:MAG: hypothetical protein Q9M94_01425 [Candidatus Gracilibacteria bacterium]|nr:hypothetical protein [Candidatus Gracilibacteria bacterium]MDQ7022533.1 hypothetical protein [Candidatus Gracilibacteria bacterium]